jgi:hypothetical protein
MFAAISPLQFRLFWYLALIPLCFTLEASGQKEIRLTGRVTDADKNTPLLFAQIALKNLTAGTVTNEDGLFSIVIPAGHGTDTLLVSYLGYETARIPLASLAGPDNIIRLQPKSIELREVEVVALSPEEVMRRAFYAIPDNYGRDSLMLRVFYRTQKYAGKKLAEFAEAIIEDLKTGYFHQNTMKEYREKYAGTNLTRLVKGRVVSDTNLVNSMGDVGKMAGCLGCIFTEDWVELSFRTVLDEETYKSHSFKMEETANPEGGRIYHIWFDQAGNKYRGYKGELFIEGTSFAIMKIKLSPSFKAFDQYEKEKYRKTYTINNIPGWIAEMPLLDRTITYSLRGNRWCLCTIRDSQWVTFTNPSGGQKTRMGYKNDLVVTEVITNPDEIRNFQGNKKTGINQRWDQITGSPDENFWASFNYVPVEESLKQAITGIKK